MELSERIAQVDSVQARRFDRLGEAARKIAVQGICRHLDACDRLGVEPDYLALKEIIDDALNGRRVWLEVTP